jgi:hypothetical protein
VFFNEARFHEVTLNINKHAWIFSRLSIVSFDGKQHLSEVVFSALVGVSLLEKYPTFGRGKRKQQANLEHWKPNHSQSIFLRQKQKKSESSARNVL